MPKTKWVEVRSHIKQDVEYPANCAALVEACNRMSDVPKADRDWFMKTLPHGTYKSADEVIKAVKL